MDVKAADKRIIRTPFRTIGDMMKKDRKPPTLPCPFFQMNLIG